MRYIATLFIILTTFTSCVTKKIYDDLNFKYNRLLNSNSELVENNEKLVAQRNQLQRDVKNLEKEIQLLSDKKIIVENEYTAAKARLDELIASYEALETESAKELIAKAKEINNLLRQLEEKEKALSAKEHNLTQLQAELEARSETIYELEELIAAKEAKMTALRDAISNALHSFEGKGLTVTHKNGKVYVSMENKLLFSSGSWAVGAQGKNAVINLAQVLADNSDIEVLIEGHTDNVPYNGTTIQDNWDLSVKRATAIVRILQNNGVNPKQVTAAGRSKYIPIADNTNSEGKAKNRRIEIILAPNLDRINELLGE
ncbi:MAG: OmpA family protein [Bacteroidota bacterium]